MEQKRQTWDAYTRALKRWVASNPSAWAGWPTHYNPRDVPQVRARFERMERIGCPVDLGFPRARAVALMHETIAEVRLRQRRAYTSTVIPLAF